MTIRVDVAPAVLSWALDVTGADEDGLHRRFKVDKWLNAEARPTLKQLQDFARAAGVPFGYLLLPGRPPGPFRSRTSVKVSRARPPRAPTSSLSWASPSAGRRGTATTYLGSGASHWSLSAPLRALSPSRRQSGFEVRSASRCPLAEERGPTHGKRY